MSLARASLLSGAAIAAIATMALAGNPSGPAQADLTSRALVNRTAFIPAPCYTRTLDMAGTVHNPCFACHVRSRAPNYIDDKDLQLSYAFPAPALENPWTNLFVDRRPLIARISDADILAYVRTDNYMDADGGIRLADELASPPPGWDYDKDGNWAGYVPDTYFNFDADGFDVAPDGTDTGWRVFAYTPAPGTFWPAAGSADDVMIRLPDIYRQTAEGAYSRAVYELNLAIVEALIKRRDIAIAPTAESRYGVDLDRDGKLDVADRVAFAFDPRNGINMSYVGRAGAQDYAHAPLAAGLFPLGTEFAHSVRYLDVDATTGAVGMAVRMKEFRYMKKTAWLTYGDLQQDALDEIKEAHDFPDRLPIFDGDVETGIDNGAGWQLQAFIEDARGDLRPQTFEETVFCQGCHGGTGVTDDSTFAFARKLGPDTAAGGWRHTGGSDSLYEVADPTRGDGRREYLTYLAHNGAGDEFRANGEITGRFFRADGSIDPDLASAEAADVSILVNPSPERALDLDKAYRTIVESQSFVRGRDANIAPLDATVHRTVTQDEPTGIETPVEAWFHTPR